MSGFFDLVRDLWSRSLEIMPADVYKNDDHLRGLWLLEETSGNRADSSPYGNDLTDVNTVGSSVDSQEGSRSADFERGNSEYLTITHAAQIGLSVARRLSMGAWIKIESLASGATRILGKYEDTSGGHGYQLVVYDDLSIRAYISADGDTYTTCQTAASVVSVGTWAHVVAVYNGLDIRIYVDGVLSTNGSNNPKLHSGGIYENSEDFRLGAIVNDSNYFDGLMDEAFVMDRVLIPEEVAGIHANGFQDAEAETPAGIGSMPVVGLPATFRIQHELNLAEWDSQTGTGLARATPGLADSAGKLAVTISDTSSRYCEKSFSPSTAYVRYRIYLDFVGLSMGAGDAVTIHQVQASGGVATVFEIDVEYDGSDYTLTPRAYEDDASSSEGSSITIDDITQEHWVEVLLRRTGDDVTDGVVAIYLDGDEGSVQIGLDNNTIFDAINAFRLGAISGLTGTVSGVMAFDEIVLIPVDRPIGPRYFNRYEAKAFDYEVRLFVGPPFDYVDPTGIVYGSTYDWSAETTLASDLDHDSTEVVLTDASSFPSSGGILIEAYGDNEVDELIYYESKSGNTLQTITRSPLGTGQSHNHSTGATVRQWAEVTEYFKGVDMDWSRNGNILAWIANLQGTNYNSMLFRRDQSLLAMVRLSPASDTEDWTDWGVLFFGSITTRDVADDYRQNRDFTLKVEGPQAYLRLKDIESHRFGRENLAANRPVTVSSTLKDPRLEADSGEFVGAPSVAAGNLVDENVDSLWISHTVPDVTVESFPKTNFRYKVSECYPRHTIGSNHYDYQWFEVSFGEEMDDWPNLEYAMSYIYGSLFGWPGIRPFWHNPRNVSSGDIWIFCANRKKFEEAFALGKYTHIFELGFPIFNLNGSFLSMVRTSSMSYDGGHGEYTVDVVIFGNASYPSHNWPPGPKWTGGAVDMPDYTHSIRRTPTMVTDTDTAADFTEDEYPLPGRHQSTFEWLSVELPAMSATLSAQLDAGETGYAELTNLDGLTDSGRVQIDIEWIDYNSLDHDNNRLVGLTRGVGGTVDTVHNAASTVYQVEDGIASNNLLISTVAWRRRQVYNGTTLVVPEDFSIWVSAEASPDYPTGGSLPGDEWTRIVVGHGWADTTFQHDFPATRARHALMAIREMSDGGRAKLNEFEVYEALVTVSDDDDIQTYSDTGAIVEHVLVTHLGFDPDLLSILDTAGFKNWVTSKSKAANLLNDLARRTNSLLVCELDGSLTWQYDPLYPMHGLPDLALEFEREAGIQTRIQQMHGREVSQVIVNAKDTATGDVFQGVYPPTEDPYGSPLVLEDMVLGSSREAQYLAEILYRQRHNALSGTLEVAGTGEDPVNDLPLLRPTSRITLTWNLDEIGLEYTQRNFIVTGVHLSADFGKPGEANKRWDVSWQVQEYVF